eukprot:1884150-Amphidinium_carterae.1
MALQSTRSTTIRPNTPAKNDLLATINTGVLHLSTNEDQEEKKLSLHNMNLQEWYDDDNMDYDANELKTAIKDEHDSLQKTNVFTKVQASDYSQQQLKDKVNIDEIYAATPAARASHRMWINSMNGTMNMMSATIALAVGFPELNL